MPTKTPLATPEEPKRPRKPRTRANNEGSIFPYKNGWAGYVWVTTPEGNKTRKWAYGKTREETHDKWLKLHEQAAKGPVATNHESMTTYLKRWLKEVIKPNLEPATYATYEALVRLYETPASARSDSTSSPSATFRPGSTSSPRSAPAAPRRRITNARRTNDNAAQEASAARTPLPAALSPASAASCVQPSPMPSARNSFPRTSSASPCYRTQASSPRRNASVEPGASMKPAASLSTSARSKSPCMPPTSWCFSSAYAAAKYSASHGTAWTTRQKS